MANGQRRSRGPNRRLGSVAITLASTICACSAIAPPPKLKTCETDEDCKSDEICNTVCQPAPTGVPPQAVLAIAINEDNRLEVELQGCELTFVSKTTGGQFEVKKSDVVDDVELRYTDLTEGQLCLPDYERSDTPPYDGFCVGEFAARFTLTQPSRLGRGPLSQTQTFMVAAGEDPPSDQPALFEWPYYSAEVSDALPELRATVEDLRAPEEIEGGVRSSFSAVLPRSGTAPTVYMNDIAARGRCHRVMDGRVAVYESSQTVAGMTVSILQGSPVAAPSSVVPGPSDVACTTDADCQVGRACSPDFQVCGIDLEGEFAGISATSDDMGSVALPFYSYCELDASPSERQFRVSVTPDSPERGLPRLRYELEQPLEPGLIGVPLPLRDTMPGTMCMYDWGASREVKFAVTGAPKKILELDDPSRAWRCCSDVCLPVGPEEDEDLADAVPPAAPESCTDFTTVTFETKVLPPADLQAWEDAGCLPLAEDDDGFVGSFSSVVASPDASDPDPDCVDGTCTAWLTNGAIGETREYEVRLEQPVGSLFRSTRTTVSVGPDTTTLPVIALEPRVVLAGKIACDEDVEGCTPANATIVAERLRQSDEDPADALAPYYYSARSLPNGEFRLPVNPGVYVVTARPDQGQPGAPTEYRVLDLRENASAVELRPDGLLWRSDPTPLVIEPGRPVRVELDGFSVGTRIEPYDTGSWRAQAQLEELDLNLPTTCYGDADRGCRIRQISAPVRSLANGVAQFTTRDRGSSSCD